MSQYKVGQRGGHRGATGTTAADLEDDASRGIRDSHGQSRPRCGDCCVKRPWSPNNALQRTQLQSDSEDEHRVNSKEIGASTYGKYILFIAG